MSDSSVFAKPAVVDLLTWRADAVRELRRGSPRDESLDVLPFTRLVPDALAEGADREQPLQHLDLAMERVFVLG